MNRYIIIVIQGDRIAPYTEFKKCCKMEGLKYWTLARLKFPIVVDDIAIHKLLLK